MGCGCANADGNCNMNVYLLNSTGSSPPAGGTLTLQEVKLEAYAPCVLNVVPASGSAQLVAWAYEWDEGSISYNMPNGEVLTISYDGGSVDDADASFATASTVYFAQKQAYNNGMLFTVGLQTSHAADT